MVKERKGADAEALINWSRLMGLASIGPGRVFPVKKKGTVALTLSKECRKTTWSETT